jgi:CDP-diglyceride synthetase
VNSSAVNRWTWLTILGALVCSTLAAIAFFLVTHHIPSWWILLIGGLVGVVAVQIAHKRADPFG